MSFSFFSWLLIAIITRGVTNAVVVNVIYVLHFIANDRSRGPVVIVKIEDIYEVWANK